MASASAPTYYFSGIGFNAGFFQSSTSSSSLYLSKTKQDTAQGTITFNSGLNSNSIASISTSDTVSLYTSNTGTINIGNALSTVKINGSLQLVGFLTSQGSGIGKTYNTTYQNNGINVRFVSVVGYGTGAIWAYTDTNPNPTTNVGVFSMSGQNVTLFFCVCPGSYYKVTTTGAPNLNSWTEWI